MNRLLIVFLSFFLINNAVFALPYDFSSTKSVPIKLQITEEISTKMSICEGQELKFKSTEDIYYRKNLILKKGTIVPARIEMIITSGMNGFPAEIIIGDFQIPNIKQSQLMGTYIKTGQNRSLIVYPIKWALTWLPGVGSLTNLIKGGHAKIKTKDVITIFYYPQWK